MTNTPQPTYLERIAKCIRGHGFTATVDGHAVAWELPWTNTAAGTTGTDTLRCTTAAQALEQLGY